MTSTKTKNKMTSTFDNLNIAIDDDENNIDDDNNKNNNNNNTHND